MSNPKVLLVDDWEENLKLMRVVFEQAGAEVVCAKSAQEALDLYIQHKSQASAFNFISLDIHMPEMNGVSLAEKLRQQNYTGPLVVFTANASMLGKRECQAHGVDAYFSKVTLNVELAKALLQQFARPNS